MAKKEKEMPLEWMTLLEAAQYLRLGRTSFYKYLNDGRIRGYRLFGDGALRFKRTDLDSLFQRDEGEKEG